MRTFYGETLNNPLMLGTAQYPSPAIMGEAFRASGAGVATVSLRREAGGERAGQAFWELIRELGVKVLPNTAGCYSVQEAVTTAHMAREVFDTTWIKLEVIGDADTLQPDVYGLVEAARILTEEGFEVFPYTTEDLIVCERLVQAGCRVLMPWGAPIGSGLGLNNEYGLKVLRARFEDIPLVVVVMNDCAYGAELHFLQERDMSGELSQFPDIDYAPVAEAFGFQAATVRTLDELQALAPLLASPDGPVFLDCKINSSVMAPFMLEGPGHAPAKS